MNSWKGMLFFLYIIYGKLDMQTHKQLWRNAISLYIIYSKLDMQTHKQLWRNAISLYIIYSKLDMQTHEQLKRNVNFNETAKPVHLFGVSPLFKATKWQLNNDQWKCSYLVFHLTLAVNPVFCFCISSGKAVDIQHFWVIIPPSALYLYIFFPKGTNPLQLPTLLVGLACLMSSCLWRGSGRDRDPKR